MVKDSMFEPTVTDGMKRLLEILNEIEQGASDEEKKAIANQLEESAKRLRRPTQG